MTALLNALSEEGSREDLLAQIARVVAERDHLSTRVRDLIDANNREIAARRELQSHRDLLAERLCALAAALDVFDLISHLDRQIDFSARTFGPGPRTKGVVDHIRKELAEIEAAPGDVMEWIDVVILAFDGAWRSGASPRQIVSALAAKQAKNEARAWPDWRAADPDKAIEHVRTEA